MTQPNSIKVGPQGDVQEVTPGGRVYRVGFEPDLYIDRRTASGKLKRQIIGAKTVHTLDYEVADDATVERLDYLYRLGTPLIIEVVYPTKTAVLDVLMSPFDRTRLLAVHGGLWENVTAEFREI